MENEELLPKPLTDLPLPEKELSEHATPASQGLALRSYRSKFVVLGIVAVILLVLLGGVYMLGRNSVFKELNPSNPAIPPKSPVVYEGSKTPTPIITDETANWKTYNATFDSFSVKYPPSLNIVEDKYNEKVFRVFIQNDNFQITITPNSNQGEYVNLDITRKNLETIGAKDFIQYKLSEENALHYHIIAKGEDTIGVNAIHSGKSYDITASPSNSDNSVLLDQILSTFKFTDSSSSTDTSTWKTYSSACRFSIKYPDTWKAAKYFIEDRESSCAYLTAPDYTMGLDSRTGFYIGVTRTKLGSKGINTIINSLEDYIKDDESIMTPRVSVGEKVNKTYGSLSGISYLPVGFEPGRSFIFIKNGFLYDINWSDKEESNHLAEINGIISSFKFTN